jgi:predicted HD phosphohydrolase
MDESTEAQWQVIGRETMAHQPRVAEQVLSMLTQLGGITDGFAVDQSMHARQTATLAERSGADDETVVAALCHDVGKVVSVFNHPEIAAAILKPYVRPELYHVVRTHQDFQGRHYYAYFGQPTDLREAHRAEPWFELAERFTDEWDQAAFDPECDTFALDHFEDRVRAVFARPRY